MSDAKQAIEQASAAFGAALAARLFRGRKGHGGAPASEVHLKEAELADMLAVAHEVGAKSAQDLLAALQELLAADTSGMRAAMNGIASQRPGGSFGIAVDDDALAREWQAFDEKLRAIEGRARTAIARASGTAHD